MIFKNIIYFRPTEQVREIFVVEFNFERCKQGKVFFFYRADAFVETVFFYIFLHVHVGFVTTKNEFALRQI